MTALMNQQSVTAIAHANIALVKYWGKRPGKGNLPAVGSLSVGLEALATRTTLSWAAGTDEVLFNGQVAAPDKAERIKAYLDLWRLRQGVDRPLAVDTHNNFPTGAGLASSASGFAALALALDRLLGANLDAPALSRLARQGSGSAARSVFGGFVEMPAQADDAEGPGASPLLPAEDWPLHVLVAITDTGEKPIGSTQAMQQAAASSPYYDAWVASHADDLAKARQAVLARDLSRLGEVAEHSCLKMHATALSSSPPVIYWTGTTLALMHRVRQLRSEGLSAFFTIDAGPQVKVVCDAPSVSPASEALAALPGVKEVIHSAIGGSPSVTAQSG